MLTIRTTNRFEKDIKKSEKRGEDLKKLKSVLEILASNKTLPPKFRDHKLVGNYTGFRDCHIEPDWLLVYKIEEEVLYLTCLGAHADLF